jgi:hypothetical protein
MGYGRVGTAPTTSTVRIMHGMMMDSNFAFISSLQYRCCVQCVPCGLRRLANEVPLFISAVLFSTSRRSYIVLRDFAIVPRVPFGFCVLSPGSVLYFGRVYIGAAHTGTVVLLLCRIASSCIRPELGARFSKNICLSVSRYPGRDERVLLVNQLSVE